ncbi:hypothetical protein DSO57_1034262 [Entomophthora muscae]|uniref:Uncharacterized protein n=1 Tax=Entomophthora muscae TaxID=34485 RepID=A0ACC2TLY2_9FUNG|nr:hypothetical protein DSO57_1034262 [Entomophthora muscae]
MEPNVSCSSSKMYLLMPALLLATFLAAADETILVASTRTILKDLGEEDSGWISIGYLLGLTASMPLYGKLSDVFGTKQTTVGALSLFLAGSVGCGCAVTVLMLVVFRVICGVGAAGMIVLPYALIADAVCLAGRAPHLSAVECTFTLSSAAGPLIGGALVDYVNWRLAFLGSLPFTGMVILGLWLAVPPTKSKFGIKSGFLHLNLPAVLALVLAIVALVVGATRDSYASPPAIGWFAAGASLVVVYVYVEVYIAEYAIIPRRILTRNMVCASISVGLLAIPFVVCMYFIPHCRQCGQSALESGVDLLPFLLSVCIMSMMSGVFVHYLQTYRIPIWVGMALVTLGCGMVGRYDASDVVGVSLVGCGVGLNLQPLLIACHASVASEDVSTVSTLFSFFLSIGGILGLAIHTSVFHYNASIMSQEEAYHTMFLYMVPTSATGLLFSLFIADITLSQE